MEPITRLEQYLNAILRGDTSNLPKPITREEIYLYTIAVTGGGGGGTSDYSELQNKPSINGVQLSGNKSGTTLGLVNAETGKGLSTEDFTSDEKTKLGNIEAGAEANTIAKIYLNGTEIIPVDKEVFLTVITKAVNDLENYYLKTETYTKNEVDAIANSLSHLTFAIVSSLPTTDISTSTIYLILEDATNSVYSQHVYIDNNWVNLGLTSVDLSNYYNKSQIDALLLLKQDLLTFDTTPTSASTNPVTSGGIYTALAGKQNTLTFDASPTENSNNPVKSGGVYTALAGKQATLTFDNAPTENSNNPVKSDGIFDALAEKQNTLTFDNAPTQNSNNPVKSGGIYGAINTATAKLDNVQTSYAGTSTQWSNLSAEDKAKYKVVNITG